MQFPLQDSEQKIIVKEKLVGSIGLYTTTTSGYAPTAGNFGTAAGTGSGLGVHYSIDNY
jgi:hypothetical protein